MCDMTHSYVWHDSFICVTLLNHICDMTHSYVWHDSFICVTWLIHVCDETDSYVRHDSFIRVIWLIRTRDILQMRRTCWLTYRCVRATWRCCLRRVSMRMSLSRLRALSAKRCAIFSHICDMTHSHDSFTCCSHASFLRATWLIHMCDMTHSLLAWLMNTCNDSCICATWLIYLWHDSCTCAT